MDFNYEDLNLSPEEIEQQKQAYERLQQIKIEQDLLQEMVNQEYDPDKVIKKIGEQYPKGQEQNGHANNKKIDNKKNGLRNGNKKQQDQYDPNQDIFDVHLLNLQQEIGITHNERELIDQNCNEILTDENILSLKEKYNELYKSVMSLYNSEDMIKQTKDQLKQFYKVFLDAIKTSEQQSGRVIVNRISEYLNGKFSQDTEKDLTHIFMEVLSECCKKRLDFINKLEIVRQFQKYIMTGILSGINCNVLRCVQENELNHIIEITVDKFIEECKKSTQLRNQNHSNASQIDAKHPNQMNDKQYQNEAYNVEKNLMELALNQVLEYFTDKSESFSEKILIDIQIVYSDLLSQIKGKLKHTEKNILKLESLSFKQENRKFQNEQSLKKLMRAIYFRKAHQNIIDIIDCFESLNNQVNQIITSEINRYLNLVNEDQQNLQPVFFSNFFDHTINHIVSIFGEKTIPSSLKRLIEDRESLDHIKAFILSLQNEQLIQFQHKTVPQQNEGKQLTKILSYFQKCQLSTLASQLQLASQPASLTTKIEN